MSASSLVEKAKPFLLPGAWILVAAIFLLDLATPLGKAVWALYVIPLLLTSRTSSWLAPVLIAAAATILTILGVLYSPPGAPAGIVAFNRSMAMGVIWATALLILLHQAAEKNVREGEARFQLIMDHANDALCYLDLAGVIQWASQQATVLTGRPMDQLVNHSFVSVLTPASAAVAETRLSSIRRGEPVASLAEFELLRPDGTTLWVEANFKSVQADGKLVGRLLVAREITERKRTENRQAAQLAVSQVLAEATSLDEAAPLILQAVCGTMGWEVGAIWTIDRSANVLRCESVWHATSANIQEFVKLSRAITFLPEVGLPGRVWATGEPAWIPDVVRDQNFPRASMAAASGLHGAFAFPIKNGRETFGVIEFFSHEIRHPDPALLGMMADVGSKIGQFTVRKDTENALKESAERYHSLIVATSQLVWTTDADGQPIRDCPTWRDYTGQPLEELRRQDWTAAVHPDDCDRVIQAWTHALSTKSLYDIDCRIRAADGRYGHFLVKGVPILENDGRVREWVGTCTDMTERKQLEGQLHQSQKMEAVGQLAGGIAHDFNNLLTVISGYSQLVLSRLESGNSLRDEVEEIQKAGSRAAMLTRQLLAFSRRQVLQPVVLDLNTLIRDMEQMLRRLIGEDIVLATALASNLWVVKADPAQIDQVLLNLVLNARDAMPQGGRLTIETANMKLDHAYTIRHMQVQPGPYVTLSVSDTGIGMDEETQARIFEPFFTTKEEGKGTGLGLSTVYGIVKQSGGYIWVYSEPGQGSTFKIYLPQGEGEAATPSLRPKHAAVERGSEVILLVEDEEAVRRLAREVLTRAGYTVLEARNAADAFLFSQGYAGVIHLLMTDVVMPGGSGREVAERLASSRPAMKVLYMSGYTDNVIVHHRVLDAGMAFLQKPFNAEALAQKVREVLNA